MKSSIIVSIFFGMLILAPFGNLVVASSSVPSVGSVHEKQVKPNDKNTEENNNNEMLEDDEE